MQAGAEALFRHPLDAAPAAVGTGGHGCTVVFVVLFSVESFDRRDPEGFVKNPVTGGTGRALA